jgi:hypothetical protein
VEGNEVFQILLKNPVGATLSVPYIAVITIQGNSKSGVVSEDATTVRMVKLTEALDVKDLTWFTSTLSPWTKQPFVAMAGASGAISGQSDPGRVSWLQTDVEGPGTLEYDWLVKGLGLDACLLIVDGKVARTLHPGLLWMNESVLLGEGDHTIRWAFAGDSRLMQGAAYLDRVNWLPVTP